MLDMGFLPDIRRVLRHLPTRRQTLFFSATMPPPIAALSREMLHDPATINSSASRRRRSGITQAVYPVPQQLKPALLVALLKRGEMRDALVFTRTKHRADRLARLPGAARHQGRAHPRQPLAGAAHRGAGRASRAASTGCWSPPTSPRAASTSTALGHVVNFDVPVVARGLHPPRRPHRARGADRRRVHVRRRRTKRADLRDIERAIGKRLPRVTVPDFDYQRRAGGTLRGPAGGAHRGDPRPQGRRAGAVARQSGTPCPCPEEVAGAGAGHAGGGHAAGLPRGQQRPRKPWDRGR